MSAREPTGRMRRVLEAFRMLSPDGVATPDLLALADRAELVADTEKQRRMTASVCVSYLRTRGFLPPLPPRAPRPAHAPPPAPPKRQLRVHPSRLGPLRTALWLRPTATLVEVEAAIDALSRPDHRAAMRHQLEQLAEVQP